MQKLSDRALKERITGAVVLVVFAVLVVPIFLDGPSDDKEVISEAVTLPGQNSQERQQQTIVLDRDRNQPVPASATPSPARSAPVVEQRTVETPPAQASTPAVQPAEKTVTEKPAEKPAEKPPQEPVEKPPAATPSAGAESATGMWVVQLGSFSNKDNAERLAADLREQGYAAFLSQLQTDSGTLQRVRIGPQKDRESADAVAAQLARSGHKGQVVPHP